MATWVPPGLGKCTESRAVLVSAAVASAWTQAALVSKKPFVVGIPLLVSWKATSKRSQDRLEFPAMPNSVFQTLLGVCRAPVDASGTVL